MVKAARARQCARTFTARKARTIIAAMLSFRRKPLAHLSPARSLAHVSLATALALVAACASKPPPPTPRPAPPLATPATPAPRPLGLDPGLSGPERIWHLRAALNVAALGCTNRTGGAIVTRYNSLLKTRKSLLASAYQAEIREFKKDHGSDWQPEFDRYMTGLYNRLAAPDAQAQFCPVADAIAVEALTTDPRDFEAFATTSLARIEAAFLAPPPSPPPAPPVHLASAAERRAAPAVITAVAQPAPRDWRIQLGAFTGQPAADAAWAKIRLRQPGLAAYTPHFEPVPGRPELVRLQIGNPGDRGSALTLCALAAAGGFDCIPVRAS